MKLGDLKVQSFVTSMGTKEKQTIDGGITPLLTHISDCTFPSKIGSGGACSEYCAPVPEVLNPWCTVGGAQACPVENPWCTEGGSPCEIVYI